MIPGLPHQSPSGKRFLVLNASENNVDVQARVLDPLIPVDVVISVATGVIIGSAQGAGNDQSIDLTGLPAGSTVRIINKGRIQGRGGNGGSAGCSSTGDTRWAGGGGGGGVGSVPGEAGLGGISLGNLNGTDGTAGGTAFGSAGSGGTGGNDDMFGGPELSFTYGDQGGIAIRAGDIALVIDNGSGEIWVGGDGGRGGTVSSKDGESGFDPDEYDASSGRSPLTAVEGTDVTFLSGGSFPNLVDQTVAA